MPARSSAAIGIHLHTGSFCFPRYTQAFGYRMLQVGSNTDRQPFRSIRALLSSFLLQHCLPKRPCLWQAVLPFRCQRRFLGAMHELSLAFQIRQLPAASLTLLPPAAPHRVIRDQRSRKVSLLKPVDIVMSTARLGPQTPFIHTPCNAMVARAEHQNALALGCAPCCPRPLPLAIHALVRAFCIST